MAGKKTGRPRAAVPTIQTGIRLPADLLARVDVYLEQLRREVAWANPTRADAIRALLGQALEVHEAKARKDSRG